MRTSFLPSLLVLFACTDAVVPLGSPFARDAALGPAADAAVRVDASAGDGGVVDTDAGVADGPAIISDDCRPHTWCWEKPIPTGEVAAVAHVYPGDRAVYLGRSGTLASWDSGRWRIRILELPGEPVGLWTRDPEVLYLTCTAANGGGGRALVRVSPNGVETLAAYSGGSVSRLFGDREDNLFALAERVLMHWDGQQWREITGPGGDVLLASALFTGDGLLVLESWGSGSGYGRLHLYRDDRWTLIFDFAQLGQRVEGPIVAADGALWLHAFDFDRGLTSVARGVADSWGLVDSPDRLDGRLHQVGDQLWFVSGRRASLRFGHDWMDVPGFPGRGFEIVTGDRDVAWVFSEQVASRRSDATWRTWSPGTAPTLGFWRTGDQRSVLLSTTPMTWWINTPRDPRTWVSQPLMISDDVFDYDVRRNRGVIATRGGLMFIEDLQITSVGPTARAYTHVATDGLRTWIALSDAKVLEWNTFSEPIDVPRVPEAPNQIPTISALHAAGDGTLYVGTEVVTGNKEVFQQVHALGREGWREVVSRKGELGRESAVVIDSDPSGRDVWISMGDVWRGDGVLMRPVQSALGLVDLAVEVDGTVIGTDAQRVYVLSPNPWTTDVPLAAHLYFNKVFRAEDGLLRLTTAEGQVIRYTPDLPGE